MDASLAAEMAKRASALHRRREKRLHADMSWWERTVLKWAWRSSVARHLMDAGATRALSKYGDAVKLRHDIVTSSRLSPLRFLG